VWTNARRVGFRFGFAFAVLMIYPFPLGIIPKTDTLANWLNKPFEWLAIWVAESILGLPTPSMAPTGSGDTMFAWVLALVVVALAVIVAAVWTLADRRSTAYPRLAAWLEVLLRYWLAFNLLAYGLFKVIPSQFGPSSAFGLDRRLADMSPMGLLWTFMGSSTPYMQFGGASEMLAGLLLLFQRTRVLGAAVAAGVMLNVVMLNFCYDVPVKQFSSLLLLTAIALLAPHARRLLAAFIAEARELGTRKQELARRIVKAALVIACTYALVTQAIEYNDSWHGRTPLDGTWIVDRFAVAGVDQPPLATDGNRWYKLLIAGAPAWGVGIKPLIGKAKVEQASVVAIAHLIIVGAEVWRYDQPDPDHLVIDAGKLHVTLHRDAEPLLTSRDFHWVQETPFNR
jgi:hypothetical protein